MGNTGFLASIRKAACLGCLAIGLYNVNAQRVGIGTTNPMARFAVDSGIIIDQAQSNLPFQEGRNVGLFFGSSLGAGITSSKQNGSVVRSGLSFWTNGSRRMHIDSLGNLGIGDIPVADTRLNVYGNSNFSGLMFVNGPLETSQWLKVGPRISVNTNKNVNALLYLKGKSGTTNNWGQHIVMEALNGSDSAAILYDGDLKMRLFGADDYFIIRNAGNNTMASLSAEGNLNVAGNLQANGNGLVQSGSSAQMQIVMHTTPANLNWTINPGGSVSFNIGYSGFTGTPILVPGTISNATNTSHLLITASDVSASGATITIRNVGSITSISNNSSLRSAIIGLRN